MRKMFSLPLQSILLPIAAVACFSLAACKRADEAPPAPADVTVATPATVEPAMPATIAEPVGMSASAAPGEHTSFDAKAFAGTFNDAGTDLSFSADGTYTMQVRAESAKADLATQGTWTLEPDARHVRLDPNSKADEDRMFELVSMDELRATSGQVLRRAGKTR